MVAVPVNAVPVVPVSYRGDKWLEVNAGVRDYDDVVKLPTALAYDGAVYVRTGFNSDTGVVCYKPGPVAYPVAA